MKILRLIFALLVFVSIVSCGRNQKPNLIVITIDTLRADHMSLYGYQRNTTPNLDALARENSWFTRCYSQSAITLSSHISLFTSRYPQSHGVAGNLGHFPTFNSLMDVFRGAGYYAAGFVSSSVLAKRTALPGEFDHYDAELTQERERKVRKTKYERPAELTVAAAEKWLAEYEASSSHKPFLVWIHLIDPHGPYNPPEEKDIYVNDRFSQPNQTLELGDTKFALFKIPDYQVIDGKRDSAFYVARYDAEIHYADKALGSFFQFLKSKQMYDSSVLVVTADHGETMTEHRSYFSHGMAAYEEDVRVPLITKDVKGKNRFAELTQNMVVRLIDVSPTLCSLFGMNVPSTFQGKDLFHAKNLDSDPVYSFGNYAPDYQEVIGTQFTVLQSSIRYVKNIPNGKEELYDHASDPKEMKDIAEQNPEKLSKMRNQLDTFFSTVPKAVPSRSKKLTKEEEEQMKSLGYLN